MCWVLSVNLIAVGDQILVVQILLITVGTLECGPVGQVLWDSLTCFLYWFEVCYFMINLITAGLMGRIVWKKNSFLAGWTFDFQRFYFSLQAQLLFDLLGIKGYSTHHTCER